MSAHPSIEQEASEIIAAVLEAHNVRDARITSAVLDCLLSCEYTITGPTPSRPICNVIMAPAGHGGATSIKLSNVRLDIGALCAAIANGTLAIASTTGRPILLILCAIAVWKSLTSCMKVTLDENCAGLLWAMWQCCGEDRVVSKRRLRQSANRLLSLHGGPRLSPWSYRGALRTLSKIRCIEEAKNAVRLLETIEVRQR